MLALPASTPTKMGDEMYPQTLPDVPRGPTLPTLSWEPPYLATDDLTFVGNSWTQRSVCTCRGLFSQAESSVSPQTADFHIPAKPR